MAKTSAHWLTTTEAIDQVGVTYATLWKWSTHGHKALGGRKLKIRHPKRAGSRGQSPVLFRASDIEKIRKARSGEVSSWGMRVEDAAQFIGVQKLRIRKWSREGHPALKGRKLKKRKESVLRDDNATQRIDVFCKLDLNKIREWDGSEVDSYISVASAATEFGWTEARIYRWTEHCPWIGRKLSTKSVHAARSDGRIAPAIRVSHKDLLAVQDKLDAEPQSIAEWMTGHEADDVFGFRYGAIYRWAKVSCPWLDGRKLRHKSEKRKVGPTRSKAVLLFHREDLASIKSERSKAGALRNSKDAITGEVEWLTVSEFADRIGRATETVRDWLRNGLNRPNLTFRKLPPQQRRGSRYLIHRDSLKRFGVDDDANGNGPLHSVESGNGQSPAPIEAEQTAPPKNGKPAKSRGRKAKWTDLDAFIEKLLDDPTFSSDDNALILKAYRKARGGVLGTKAYPSPALKDVRNRKATVSYRRRQMASA